MTDEQKIEEEKVDDEEVEEEDEDKCSDCDTCGKCC